MTFLEALRKYNIPSDSYVSAIQHISNEESTKGKLSKKEYQARINEICNIGEDIEDEVLVEYVYKYLIQETLRTSINDDSSDNIYDLYALAEKKANKFIAENQHLWVTDEEHTDSNGNSKPKRGTKKEATCKLWAERKDDGLSRQEWIKLLMDEVGCTKSGASTYYAKLKKGEFGC